MTDAARALAAEALRQWECWTCKGSGTLSYLTEVGWEQVQCRTCRGKRLDPRASEALAALSADPPASTDRERLADKCVEYADAYAGDTYDAGIEKVFREAAAFIRQPVAAEIEAVIDDIKSLDYPEDQYVIARSVALLRRLVPAGEGWQPIESAPKGDGEEGPDILLFGPVHPHSGYKRPFYIENSRWYRTAWTITFMDGHGQPTHWQPLPSAPMEDKPT